MTTIHSLTKYLAGFLEPQEFDDALVNGLQVEGTREVKFLATAVSASQYAIEKAVSMGADVLLTHHGLFWKGEVLEIRGHTRKRVARLIEGGLHLLSYHLPLDAHPEVGNAWPVARAFGLSSLSPFGHCGRGFAGVAGIFSEPKALKWLFEEAGRFWGAQGLLVAGQAPLLVKSCAVVTGQASRFLLEAIELGVDCFITGVLDENGWHVVRESPIHAMAFGHFATERHGVRLLGEHLAKHFSLGHTFIDEDNPC